MEKNRFYNSWLAQREPFDFLARSNLLVNEIKKDSKIINNLVDLGTGTGSFLRWYICQKLTFHTGTLIDYDRRLLNSIGLSFRKFFKDTDFVIKKLNADKYLFSGHLYQESSKILLNRKNIFNFNTKFNQYDLISLSALADLLSKKYIKKLLSNISSGKYLYFSLCFNGKIKWLPTNEFDKYITRQFNNHQIQDKGFGVALGSNSIKYIELVAKQEDYSIFKKDSSWKIDTLTNESQLFQQKYLNIILNALKKDEITDKKVLQSWFSKRIGLIKNKRSNLNVGHNDILIKT